MQIFDIVKTEFFRPLTGCNKREYADIISLIWELCRRMPMYSVEKSTVLDEVESYFIGLGQIEELDLMDDIDSEEVAITTDARTMGTAFVRRLKKTGWLEEKEGNYEEESEIAINYIIIPIIRSFAEVVTPKMVTYKGKLFKIFTLLNSIKDQKNPYETILKEVSNDMDDLNESLRHLAASIADHMDNLTKGKTPEQVLDLFNNYESKIVVGAYHRFKTNDNLFYYRSSLYEQLDCCEFDYMDKLTEDYMEVERVSLGEASIAIHMLINKIREDLKEMNNIMKVIDERHMLYRTRAVQRAHFLLLSDGSIKSKINSLLNYYSLTIKDKEELQKADDSLVASVFQIYEQGYFSHESIAQPVPRKRPTEIEMMELDNELDLQFIEEEQRKLLEYARNALTAENVNKYALEILKNKKAVSAESLMDKNSDDIVKIIGIYTYSKSLERAFDVVMKDRFVTKSGIRFKDFIIEERK